MRRLFKISFVSWCYSVFRYQIWKCSDIFDPDGGRFKVEVLWRHNGHHFPQNKHFGILMWLILCLPSSPRPIQTQKGSRLIALKLECSRHTLHLKGGSRVLKWGVNFCNNVREIKYYFNIWGIREKKKEEGSEKGGWKFTHFTSPGSAPDLAMTICPHHREIYGLR